MRKYIDSKTFDIIENPDFFKVDYDIAETISVLNKKGYRTIFSCSGHNRNGFLSHTIKDPIQYYEGWIKKHDGNSNAHIVDKDDHDEFYKEKQCNYSVAAFETIDLTEEVVHEIYKQHNSAIDSAREDEYKSANTINEKKMKLASYILDAYYGKYCGIKYFFNF